MAVRRQVVGSDDTLGLAAVLAFSVIGLEQLRHTTVATLANEPVYQAMHWFSDSLLALPFAALAVIAGHWLARRLGHDVSPRARRVDRVAHAVVIAFVFVLLLVPGAYLHEQADRLTHVNAQASLHSHTRLASPLEASLASAGHALQDGLEGQVVGLPILLVALLAGRGSAGRCRPADCF